MAALLILLFLAAAPVGYVIMDRVDRYIRDRVEPPEEQDDEQK